MSLGPIVYILIALAFFLYRKAQKDAEKEKEKPRPMNGPGSGPRKDADFSLEEILRKIQEKQQPTHQRTVNEKPAAPKVDDRLPFEKRQALEKTAMRSAKNRETTREMIDYDERAIQRIEAAKTAQHSERQKKTSTVQFHFKQDEEHDPDIRSWLDLRKAIIGAEILKRPEY